MEIQKKSRYNVVYEDGQYMIKDDHWTFKNNFLEILGYDCLLYGTLNIAWFYVPRWRERVKWMNKKINAHLLDLG